MYQLFNQSFDAVLQPINKLTFPTSYQAIKLFKIVTLKLGSRVKSYFSNRLVYYQKVVTGESKKQNRHLKFFNPQKQIKPHPWKCYVEIRLIMHYCSSLIQHTTLAIHQEGALVLGGDTGIPEFITQTLLL